MKKVILISGKAEHGKTSMANSFKRYFETGAHRTLILSFADYLKFICERYYSWDGKKNFEGRELLQYIGTDVIREKDAHFWVNTIRNLIRALEDEYDYFIVDDARFLNEILGFSDFPSVSIRIVRVDSDGITPFKSSLSEEQLNHPSETGLDGSLHDIHVIIATGIGEVDRTVERLLTEHSYLWE